MKKIFYVGLLVFAISCSSGENKTSSEKGTEGSNSPKGNSAGSNTIEMDTLHMDTSTHTTSKDSDR